MSPHVVDQLSAYLDGELALQERTAVEAHLGECAECARRLEELAAVDELARGLPADAPATYFDSFPTRVRERLGPRPQPRPWGLPAWTLAAAAALVLAVVTPLTLRNRTRPEPARVAEAPAQQAAPPATQASPPSRAAGKTELTDSERDKLRSLAYTGEASPVETKKEAPPAKPSKPQPPQPAEPSKNDGSPKRQQEEGLAERVEVEREPPAPPAGAPAAMAPKPAATEAQTALAQAPPPAGEQAMDQAMDQAAKQAAPAGGGAGPESRAAKSASADEAKRKDASRGRVGASLATAGESGYQALLARHPRTSDEARALRDSWGAFARDHADDPRADEARVRAIEAAAEAWRLGGDPADLAAAREDAAAYLKRTDATQAERVRALLRDLER